MVYWGYNAFTRHLLSSWNIQVGSWVWKDRGGVLWKHAPCKITPLGGGNSTIFWGKMNPIWYIFFVQRGWNHQLDNVVRSFFSNEFRLQGYAILQETNWFITPANGLDSMFVSCFCPVTGFVSSTCWITLNHSKHILTFLVPFQAELVFYWTN